MEPKKSRKANIDKWIGNFFMIGLLFSLFSVIVAFQWKFYEKQNYKLTSDLVIDEDEEIADITKQEKKPPPPPPPPEIQVVEDKVEIEEDQPEVLESDIDEDVAIEAPPVEEEKDVKEEEIFLVVEDQPAFPGGESALFKYIQNNIQYPSLEKENGIDGLVVVNFVVDKDGSITDVKVVKGVSPGLDKEAIRVVKNMPSWKPGKQRGKPVKVRMNLPIRFTLSN